MVEQIHFARRGFRELPGATTQIRGSTGLPYNPGRPLRLPGGRNPRRRPQLNLGGIFRLLLPVAVLAGLGVGIFFLVDTVINNDDSAATPAVTATPAVADTTTATDADAPADQPAASATDADTQPAGSEAAAAASQSQSAQAAAAQSASPVEQSAPSTIITSADVGGAATLVESGGARAIPSGIPGRTLADGTAYDPTDASVAISSVWPLGTVLQLTRLPRGPLLTEEDLQELAGQSITVVVADTGSFPYELQLSPAAYQLVARDFEPIIALRMEVIEAPPR